MNNIAFIEHLIDLALKDNRLTANERAILYERGKECGLSEYDIDALIAMKEQEWQTKKAEASSSGEQAASSSSGTTSDSSAGSATPPPPPTSSTLDDMVDDRPSFWSGGWRESGKKLFLNILPWGIVVLVSLFESITNFPFLSIISWVLMGSNVIFWVVLVEHSLVLLLIWVLVKFLKRNVYDTLPEDKKTKRKMGQSVSEKGERPLSQILRSSISLPGWSWKIACVLFVILELSILTDGVLTFESLIGGSIAAVVTAYVTVYVLTVLYLYFFRNGTKHRRVVLFSVLGAVTVISLTCEVVTKVDFHNLDSEIWFTEFQANLTHSTNKLQKVTNYYIQKGDLEKALEYARIENDENHNTSLIVLVIQQYIANNQYDKALPLAEEINHEAVIKEIADHYIEVHDYDTALAIAERLQDIFLRDDIRQKRMSYWIQTKQFDNVLTQLRSDLSKDGYTFRREAGYASANDSYNDYNCQFNQRLDEVLDMALLDRNMDIARQCVSLYQPYAYLVNTTLVKKRLIFSDDYVYTYDTHNPDKEKAEEKIKQYK